MLERVRFVEETAEASIVFWSFWKIDMACQPDEGCTTAARLHTDLMALSEYVPAHATVHSELHGAQGASSRF